MKKNKNDKTKLINPKKKTRGGLGTFVWADLLFCFSKNKIKNLNLKGSKFFLSAWKLNYIKIK
jgi:hypothetical protein